ncbi:MAG: hypothetical protein AB8H86_05560 [Polyangiales bacterium]
MRRVASVFPFLLMLGCPGFSISNDDGGVEDVRVAPDAGVPRVDADVSPEDASIDTRVADAGPCVLGDPCDDGNACTEGERCTESGCGGGSAVVCEGTETRCAGSAIIEEALTGACDAEMGCVADSPVVTVCPFLCSMEMCASCSWTDWTQTSLPLTVRGSAMPNSSFAVDEEGGQHIAFPTERLGEDGFYFTAVDYAYRANDAGTWEVSPVSSRVDLPDLSLVIEGEEPHLLVSDGTSFGAGIDYWRREEGEWVEENVLSGPHAGGVSLVIAGGQAHVLRSSGRGLIHAQRSAGGDWTEEPVLPGARPRELSAVEAEGDIRVVFRDGDDALGFARYDGLEWTLRTESVGASIIDPKLAIAPDGTVVTSYVLSLVSDIGVGTISSAGVWSTTVLTDTMASVTDTHAIAIDRTGGTHVVFQTLGGGPRVTRSAYRLPGGDDVFTFRDIASGVEQGLNLHVDEGGRLRMLGRHVLDPAGEELRLSSRQTCLSF